MRDQDSLLTKFCLTPIPLSVVKQKRGERPSRDFGLKRWVRTSMNLFIGKGRKTGLYF